MKNCENCKHSEPIGGGLACMGQKGMPFVSPTDCCDGWKTNKPTNADRIRGMTDEELAGWLADILHCHGRLYANRYAYECPSECPLWNCCKEPPGSISDWLKQEVTE